MQRENSWLGDIKNRQAQFYLDEADDIIIARHTTRDMLVQLFGYRFPDPRGLHLLELGSGNGFITAGIAGAYPDNHFTLMDGNQQMLASARELFPAENFQFKQDVLEHFFVHQDRTARYDFIYSSNAIHHLDHQEKTGLYQQIYTALNHGGLFINIDVVLPPTDLSEQWSLRLWGDWLRRRQESRHTGTPDKYADLPEVYKHKEENQPGRLINQLQQLEQIGFQNVDCYFKHSIFCLFAGTK